MAQIKIQDVPGQLRAWIEVWPGSQCWIWIGQRAKGYATATYKGKRHNVHRLLYKLLIGEPPSELHHRCEVPRCVNPAHLEPVTSKEHKARHPHSGQHTNRPNARKTHCPRGHPYEGDNLIIEKNGTRKCRACRQARDRARRPRQL